MNSVDDDDEEQQAQATQTALLLERKMEALIERRVVAEVEKRFLEGKLAGAGDAHTSNGASTSATSSSNAQVSTSTTTAETSSCSRPSYVNRASTAGIGVVASSTTTPVEKKDGEAAAVTGDAMTADACPVAVGGNNDEDESSPLMIASLQRELECIQQNNREMQNDIDHILKNQRRQSKVPTYLRSGSGGLGEDIEDGLPHDTFTLMTLFKYFSLPWTLGFIAFVFQLTLSILIIVDQISAGINSTVFNVPFQVSTVVRIAQFFTIILVLATQSDILTAITTLIILRDTRECPWEDVINEPNNRSTWLWFKRIFVINVMKLLQGLLVLFASFVIIVQSYDIIELLKDFTALLVLSETDNILFYLADNGYLGATLKKRTKEAKRSRVPTDTVARRAIRMSMSDASGKKRSLSKWCFVTRARLLIYARPLVILTLFIAMFSGWLVIVVNQNNGTYFHLKYPGCYDGNDWEIMGKVEDGTCDGGILNRIECEFDGGDCVNFNFQYPLCKVYDELLIGMGDGECQEAYNLAECDWDGGDCCTDERAHPFFGDGSCNGGQFYTSECKYDNGDCDAFNLQYPNCPIDELKSAVDIFDDRFAIPVIGDGICSGVYALESCGYEDGDCDIDQLGQDISPVTGVARFANEAVRFMGYGVVLSGNGQRLAVGAPFVDGEGNVDDATTPGLIRVLEYDVIQRRWVQVGKDVLGARNGDAFGLNVAMNHDGSRFVAGSVRSNGADDVVWAVGLVRVFDFDVYKQDWVQVGQSIYGDDEVDLLGFKVGMTADGSRLVTVAPGNDGSDADGSALGQIRVYQLEDSSSSAFSDEPSERRWEQVGRDILGSQPLDRIGFYSLDFASARGDTLVYSSGMGMNARIKVYKFDELSQDWTQAGQDFPAAFNYASALSADGDRVAFSSPADGARNGPDQVHVFGFDSSANEWMQLGNTVAVNSSDVGLGYNIAVSSDGNKLAIGGHKGNMRNGANEGFATGAVMLYNYDPFVERWVRSSHEILGGDVGFDDGFVHQMIYGIDVSFSDDGSTLAVGSYRRTDNQGFVKTYITSELYCPYSVDLPDVANGLCRGGYYNSELCSYDGGSCESFNNAYPDCPLGYLNAQAGDLFDASEVVFGDGICSGGVYSIEECGYEDGDCGRGEVIQDVINEGARLPDSTDFDAFDVSMSPDGLRIAAESPFVVDENTGSFRGLVTAFEFTSVRPGYVLEGNVINSQDDASYSEEIVFKSSNGNRAVVLLRLPGEQGGSLRVFEFEEVDSEWNQVGPGVLFDVRFNQNKIDISSDGSRLAVSDAPPSSGGSPGRIQIFELDSSDPSNKHWVPAGQIDGTHPFDYVGFLGLAMNSDGNRVLFTGLLGPRVYEFTQRNETSWEWVQLGEVIQDQTQFFTFSEVAISADGGRAAFSDDGTVNVYDFIESTGEWLKVGQTLNPSISDAYEYSIDVSSDGMTMALGEAVNDPASGNIGGVVRIYTYDILNDQWVQAGEDIVDNGGREGVYRSIFGGQLSLSADGSRLAIAGHTVEGAGDEASIGQSFVAVINVDEVVGGT